MYILQNNDDVIISGVDLLFSYLNHRQRAHDLETIDCTMYYIIILYDLIEIIYKIIHNLWLRL